VGAFKIILSEEPRFPLDWLQSCDQSLKYYTDKKENQIFLIYKERRDRLQSHIRMTNGLLTPQWLNICVLPGILGSPSSYSYMTLQPIPLNFLIGGKYRFLFYPCRD
jgi:hypothetical protein